MARIKIPATRSKAQEITLEETFHILLTDSAARSLAEGTLKTYHNHLHCVSLCFDISTPPGKLSRNKMDEMVAAIRKSGLAANSISSYVQVTTVVSICAAERTWDPLGSSLTAAFLLFLMPAMITEWCHHPTVNAFWKSKCDSGILKFVKKAMPLSEIFLFSGGCCVSFSDFTILGFSYKMSRLFIAVNSRAVPPCSLIGHCFSPAR